MLKLACLWISHRTNTTRRTPSKHLSPRTGLLTLHTHTHTVYPKRIAIGFDKSLVLHTLSFSPLFFSPLYLSLSLSSRLVVALSVTMGLFAIELAGFFSGVSMFNCTQGLLCILYLFSTLPQNPVHYQSTYNAQYSSGHQSQSWRTTVCFRSCSVLILRGQSHQQVRYSRS